MRGWCVLQLMALASHVGAIPLAATRLRVEYADAPVNVDAAVPRFSWALASTDRNVTQSASRIIVRRTWPAPATLVWDSGRMNGSTSLNVELGVGVDVEDDADFEWSVQWWNGEGVGAPQASSTFSTSPRDNAGWAGAQWLGGTDVGLLRALVTLPAAPARARLYIATLGAHAALVNGLPADAHRLSAYTVFGRRVLYYAADVTAALMSGCNALGVMLGSGRFGKTFPGAPRAVRVLLSVDDGAGGRLMWYSAVAGEQVQSVGMTLAATPLPWNVTSSWVQHNDDFHGETHDARLQAALAGWDVCSGPAPSGPAWVPASAVVPNASCGSPSCLLLSSIKAPVVEDSDAPPPAVRNVSAAPDGSFIADLGAGTAGFCGLAFPGGCPAGAVVTLTYGEQRLPNGSIADNCNMRDTYICSGRAGEAFPGAAFSYYGMRWITVRGYPYPRGPAASDFACVSLHAAASGSGSFTTGGAFAQLDAIVAMSRASIRANSMEVPTDDPNRSRQGWLGDAHLAAEPALLLFDSAAFYTQFLDTIADAQHEEDEDGDNVGSVPDIAPHYGDSTMPSDVTWGMAYPLIVLWIASYCADARVIEVHADGVARYADYLLRVRDPSGLISRGQKYGDWETLARNKTSPCITNTNALVVIDAAAAFRAACGNSSGAAYYTAAAATLRSVLLQNLYSPVTGAFCDGEPIDQALALADGGLVTGAVAISRSGHGSLSEGVSLAPRADVVEALVRGVTSGPNANHSAGGILSAKFVAPALAAAGRTDLALEMLAQTDFPSFGAWLLDGATTLREAWADRNADIGTTHSFDHQMFAGGLVFDFATLAGLGRARGSASWASLIVTPHPVAPLLAAAAATLDTAMGPVVVSWRAAGGSGSCARALAGVNVTVPPGATASVLVAIGSAAAASTATIVDAAAAGGSGSIWESGGFVPGVQGVWNAGFVDDDSVGPAVAVHTGSGAFELVVIYSINSTCSCVATISRKRRGGMPMSGGCTVICGRLGRETVPRRRWVVVAFFEPCLVGGTY